MIVLNLNNIVETFARVYEAKKSRLIIAMKSDFSDVWQQRGKRFEVFRPKHEKPQPSEWYVPLYALLHPLVVLGIRKPGRAQVQKKGAPAANTKIGRFERVFMLPFGKSKAQEPERSDEGWVL